MSGPNDISGPPPGGLSVSGAHIRSPRNVSQAVKPREYRLNAMEGKRLGHLISIVAVLNCSTESDLSLSAEADRDETDTPGCFPSDTAHLMALMNIREEPSASSEKLGVAQAGTYDVKASVQGDTHCWINLADGWIARTARVSGTKPSAKPVNRTVSQPTSPSVPQSTAVQQQSTSSAEQPASQSATQNALALYDDNRNG